MARKILIYKKEEEKTVFNQVERYKSQSESKTM